MYDLIIVGGGPAGLTAAIYAIRKRLNVFLVSQDLGGKTNYHMDLPDLETHHVIRGVEVVEKFWRELDYLEFARHLEPVIEIKRSGKNFTVVSVGGDQLLAKCVIFATGAKVKPLEVPGEKEFLNRGVSYSALSHAPLFFGKRTAVVGDSDRALKAATELSVNASTVHLIAQNTALSEIPLVRRLASNVRVILWEGYRVKEIQGTSFAERLMIESDAGLIDEVEIDGVFVENGLFPNSDPIRALAKLDDQGRVKIDKLNRTSCPGLFAAGDVTDAFAEQVLIAVGEGAKAALSAYEYLLPTL
jgi:thioredoxin reductase